MGVINKELHKLREPRSSKFYSGIILLLLILLLSIYGYYKHYEYYQANYIAVTEEIAHKASEEVSMLALCSDLGFVSKETYETAFNKLLSLKFKNSQGQLEGFSEKADYMKGVLKTNIETFKQELKYQPFGMIMLESQCQVAYAEYKFNLGSLKLQIQITQ